MCVCVCVFACKCVCVCKESAHLTVHEKCDCAFAHGSVCGSMCGSVCVWGRGLLMHSRQRYESFSLPPPFTLSPSPVFLSLSLSPSLSPCDEWEGGPWRYLAVTAEGAAWSAAACNCFLIGNLNSSRHLRGTNERPTDTRGLPSPLAKVPTGCGEGGEMPEARPD